MHIPFSTLQTSTESNIEALRNDLVAELKRNGAIASPAVEAAFRSVPRDIFVPDLSPGEVYRDWAIPIKQADGRILSASSQPSMMAIMLEQLQLEPGDRVLEIGTGSGYNAALMSQIVGKRGQVFTVDIEEDLIASARQRLSEAGFHNVEAIRGDGGLGYEAGAPYDRIILTVGAWDIVPAWWEQLAPGGRLVMPLSIRGPQQSMAFVRDGDRLSSVSARGCGFMTLRGAFAGPDTVVELGSEPGLRIITEHAKEVDAGSAYSLLADDYKVLPVGVRVTTGELFSSLTLWLALHDARYYSLHAEGVWIESGIVPDLRNIKGSRVPFLVTIGLYENGAASLVARPPKDSIEGDGAATESEFALLVQSYGPDDALARRLVEQIRAWDRRGRPAIERLQVVACRTEDPLPSAPGGIVLPKRWTRLVLNDS